MRVNIVIYILHVHHLPE